MARVRRPTQIPELAQYTKYYEHDGLLRAYANRNMLLTVLFALLTIGSAGFAIYLRTRPPTVIRVDKDGNASVVGAANEKGVRITKASAAAIADNPAESVAPTDLDGRALVRQFLNSYLAYTPDSVDRNFADALNRMTSNLRTLTMNRLRDDDTVGKIQVGHLISDFQIRSIEHVKDTPWTYVAFGVREIHQVQRGSETISRIVGRYNVRLVQTVRSETNPSGLLVAEYGEQQMVGEHETGLLQESALDKDRH